MKDKEREKRDKEVSKLFKEMADEVQKMTDKVIVDIGVETERVGRDLLKVINSGKYHRFGVSQALMNLLAGALAGDVKDGVIDKDNVASIMEAIKGHIFKVAEQENIKFH
jgi:hypothetical protein